jgi:putative addiction module killer protein
MAVGAQRLVFYEDEQGRQPFAEWLLGLGDSRAFRRIRTRILRLETGNFGDCKPVGGGVLELRVDYGPGYRVYCGRDGQTIVILLCGGDKRTQQADIRTATRYWQRYKEAK